MITRHIADLLHHHECVIVPGLGGFIKAYKPARIIHTTHEFFPPSGTVAFNSGLAVNDGILANHIASVENTSYREALSTIKQWTDKCLSSVNGGEKLILEGIGELFINKSGKLEFNPSTLINFNDDSFGLPIFFAKVSNNESFEVPDIQNSRRTNRNSRLVRLIPETLKWAAVLAPFIAFVLWGSINGNIIDNYVHNYTGMYSWVQSTPGKTVALKAVAVPVKTKEVSKPVIQSPASILAGENITFDPGVVSYTELDKNKITRVEPVQLETPEVSNTGQNYFIIGGAFRDHGNALKLITMLKEQGYPASIIDTTSGGLYIVSMKRFGNYDEAANQLSEIKKSGFPSSWILKKQRG